MDIDEIKQNYDDIHPKAVKLMGALCEQITQLLSNNDITLAVPLECRVKKFESISEKIRRKSLNVETVLSLPDFIGMRLILLFNRDQSRVSEIIHESLSVISKEDTGKRLSNEQFGYQSLHYIVQIPKEWETVPVFVGLKEIKTEIQVRTLAQHIWAAASHKLQYKKEESIPEPIRRAIHRVSALLETVDLEFDRVLVERDKYIENLKTNSQDENLNVDIIEYLLDELLPDTNKISNEDYSGLAYDLNAFHINNVGLLRSVIEKHSDAVMKADKYYAGSIGSDDTERKERNVYFTHVGLVREILNKEFGDAWNEYNKKMHLA